MTHYNNELPDFENMFKRTVKAKCGCIVEVENDADYDFYEDHICAECSAEVTEMWIEQMEKDEALAKEEESFQHDLNNNE